MLPCGDLPRGSFADDRDFVPHFHAGNAGDIDGGEVHADVADDRSIIVVDNHPSTRRKLTIQAITVAYCQNSYPGGKLGDIAAAVAHHLTGFHVADLDNARLP